MCVGGGGVTGLPFPSVGSGSNAPRGAAYIPPRACVVMGGGAAGDSRFHLLKNGNQLLIVADPVTEYLGHRSSRLPGWPWLPCLPVIPHDPPATARRQRQEDASSPYVARLPEPGHTCSQGKRLLVLGGRGRVCSRRHIRLVPVHPAVGWPSTAAHCLYPKEK